MVTSGFYGYHGYRRLYSYWCFHMVISVTNILLFLPASLSHQHNTDNHAKPLITIKPLWTNLVTYEHYLLITTIIIKSLLTNPQQHHITIFGFHTTTPFVVITMINLLLQQLNPASPYIGPQVLRLLFKLVLVTFFGLATCRWSGNSPRKLNGMINNSPVCTTPDDAFILDLATQSNYSICPAMTSQLLPQYPPPPPPPPKK